jgi:hypothetical protein
MSSQIRVEYDQSSISVFEDNKKAWTLLWSDIDRIGYRTTDAGPFQDDHFLVFRSKTTPLRYYDVSLSWPGGIALSRFVDSMKDTRLPKEGKLANSTENKTVTVWPSNHSGEPI